MSTTELILGNNPVAMASKSLATATGTLWLTASEKGLCSLRPIAPEKAYPAIETAAFAEAERWLQLAAEQLAQYFAGERQQFSVPLAPQGTAFQQAVWQQLLQIPFGQTASYGELAASMGKPTAARAVGAANGANKIAIIIPCHRVIGKQGSLTGYAWGLKMKQQLLTIEQS
ncbi:hypothetical protein HR45_12440 [Shewanella mangrovi]|uniref:Methylated-DNA--protein-cysteine methyltransferase n=1 Tax=Shewanella mangrovi TaxID=1515746 RepID=A0A094JGP6_9GAMM|nr:methylated-DNA--[protein]-cysteine S-methyltransferase [Shewanella mangrovi]KFZ37209.1 hypothetical protein HR45_12440 [Shewanella mangrovi]